MASIADIRMGAHMRHAYLFLIQGAPFAFTDEPALAVGGKDPWWTIDDRRVLTGLTVPSTLKISLELESGLIEEDTAVFSILDQDGTVPYFFGGLQKTFRQLGQRLHPREDPAPIGIIDSYGNPLNLSHGYVGTEALGPSRQRDHYSSTPYWGSLPGQDHPSHDDPLPTVTDSSTGPYLIEGRRVCLYRLVYDEETGSWPAFDQQVDAAVEGGWSPALWWGTLRQAGKVEGRTWSISCTGPGSWLRRSLNARTSTAWHRISADFALDLRESYIGIELQKRYYLDGSITVCGSDYTTFEVDPTSKATIILSIQAALTATAALAGPGGAIWSQHAGIGAGKIHFALESVTISSDEVGGFYAMVARVILSRKVWRALGYDPDAGLNNVDGPGPAFIGTGFGFLGAHPDLVQEPLVKYYGALFWTVPFGEPISGFSGKLDWAGTKAPKIYKPLYQGGISVLPGDGSQVIHVFPENNDPIYCESQTTRAHYSSVQINKQTCNASRLWCFRGKIQLPQQPTDPEPPEPVDTVQVALCYWVDDDGVMAVDELGIARGLYIDRWLDPRLFGLNYEPIDPDVGWASNDDGDAIECSPMAHLGAFYDRPDRADHTILRTLVSTGSAAWDLGTQTSDDDDGAFTNAQDYLSYGLNDLAQSWPAGDVEIYDLGLQIPRRMIDVASFEGAASDLPGGETGPLAIGKVCIQGGPLQSEELFERLMSPRGWAFSLKRGRLGLWAPHISAESKFEQGVDFEITEADLHGTAGDPASTIPSVELRPVSPYDRVAFSHTGNPTADWTSGQEELKYKARDPGSRARSGSRVRDVSAPDLVATQWFAGGDENNPNAAEAPSSWTGSISQLWERDLPRWLAQPHRLVTGLRISRPKGQDLYPGACLRLTNPWPANSVGSYGLNGNYCRVLSVTHETDSCCAVVDALVEAQPPGALRWAPILRVKDNALSLEGRYNAATRTFFVEDWGGATPPLLAFVKPADLDYPDESAVVWGLQYDGVQWSLAFVFLCESVSTVNASITHDTNGLAGSFLNRRYTILVLAPETYQPTWVKALYAQHASLPPGPGIPKLP
jgi:hypothetical protein